MSDTVIERERKIPVLKILLRNIIFIVITTIICGVIGTAAGVIMAKPVYTAKCNLILNVDIKVVNSSGETVNSSANNNNTIAKNFLPTIVTHVSNSAEVFNNANANYAGPQDSGNIVTSNFAVNYSDGSTIFTVQYSDKSEEIAKAKLTALIDSTKTYISSDSGKNLVQADTISIEKTQPEYYVEVSDKFSTFVIIGILAGIAISVVVSILLYLLDNKVKNSAELEELTGVSVIAYIDNHQ